MNEIEEPTKEVSPQGSPETKTELWAENNPRQGLSEQHKPLSGLERPQQNDSVGQNAQPSESGENPLPNRGDGRDATEMLPVGGTYGELKEAWAGQLEANGKEIHHMPPFESTNLAYTDAELTRFRESGCEPAHPDRLHEDDGLAIVMDKSDHRNLESSKGPNPLSDEMETHWENGRYQDAIDLSIYEIQESCGEKYDEAIRQALVRGEQLELEERYPKQRS